MASLPTEIAAGPPTASYVAVPVPATASVPAPPTRLMFVTVWPPRFNVKATPLYTLTTCAEWFVPLEKPMSAVAVTVTGWPFVTTKHSLFGLRTPPALIS